MNLNIPNNIINVNAIDTEGKSILTYACIQGNKTIVQLILDHAHKSNQSVLINEADTCNRTILHFACWYRHFDIVKFILEHPSTKSVVNINIRDNADRTPLHYASYLNHEPMINLLLNCDQVIDVNLPDNLGRTPLHCALFSYYSCFYDNVKALLQYQLKTNQIDFNAQDNKGRTILHLACQNRGDQEVVKLILSFASKNDKSLNIDIRDNYGMTPLDYAMKRDQLSIVEMLFEYNYK